MYQKPYNKKSNLKSWHHKYSKKYIIDIYKYLSIKDLEILNKLGIIIENRLYTPRELECIDMELYKYYQEDENETVVEIPFLKKLNISKNDYLSILNIFNKIYIDYDI